ncbi:Oidioi.mRNA.OKI2018_I69.PAR.g9113.t1.cds [Oikopleura dioica]|uniref:Oidioi.mRNA.OKI2018_I69.PAR.g9113.t1.cds n=1 Tax=Oikopleura dioica TaxID=34765 RepID=A0ABN7RMG5_OIKDI|nr:Oidioi.mRNA.OKI2018_I69.PAR.g9113.t1.cds [Oikopleura dioica]
MNVEENSVRKLNTEVEDDKDERTKTPIKELPFPSISEISFSEVSSEATVVPETNKKVDDHESDKLKIMAENIEKLWITITDNQKDRIDMKHEMEKLKKKVESFEKTNDDLKNQVENQKLTINSLDEQIEKKGERERAMNKDMEQKKETSDKGKTTSSPIKMIKKRIKRMSESSTTSMSSEQNVGGVICAKSPEKNSAPKVPALFGAFAS